MKHVLLSLFLTTAAFSATATVDFTRASSLEGDIPLETGIPPSREIMVLPSDQHEVHAVVVDMLCVPKTSSAFVELRESPNVSARCLHCSAFS